MAAPRDESRIVTPFMPSLLHIASVKIAVPLLWKFLGDTLEVAYAEIQGGNLSTSGGSSAQSRRAKESLLCIPHRLRRGVLEAVHGTLRAFRAWRFNESGFDVEIHHLHWRSDGTIDEVRTAQDLVRNAQFDIQGRFRTSCKHFLEESMEALWAEMVQAGSYRPFHEGVFGLWVRWLQERPRSSWTEGLVRPLATLLPRCHRMYDLRFPRWSAVFPLLTTDQRQGLNLSDMVSSDDLRFCLYALTREEEERMLLDGRMALAVLMLHLKWPLQSLFLRTAERLWSYLEGEDFRQLVRRILNANDALKDYNYAELFHRFWNAIPLRLREIAREDRDLSAKIDSFFEKQKRKRKSVDHGESKKFGEKESCV